jgi:hypothetical protein
MRHGAGLVLLFLAGCSDRSERRSSSADSAFARVQARGEVAMGVNQYTSTHHFQPLPDGGRIMLERNQIDLAGVAQIRRHLQGIAAAFARGNFALPGFVHDREVPGTAVMAERRAYISYSVDSLPRGGELRLQSSDSAAITAIHEFLAFQRQDHRSDAKAGTH